MTRVCAFLFFVKATNSPNNHHNAYHKTPIIMRKSITVILTCILLQSCVATKHSANSDATLNFNDKYIELKLDASTIMIEFSLTNNSDKEIILDWENVRFVGLDGKGDKVMHSGLRYSKRLDTHAPKSIAPHTTLHDFMSPAKGVLFVYPAEVENPTNKKVKVKMPIIIEGKRKEYIFTFDPLELYRKDKEIIKNAMEESIRE